MDEKMLHQSRYFFLGVREIMLRTFQGLYHFRGELFPLAQIVRYSGDLFFIYLFFFTKRKFLTPILFEPKYVLCLRKRKK